MLSKRPQKRTREAPVWKAPTAAEAEELDVVGTLKRDHVVVVPLLTAAQCREAQQLFEEAVTETPFIKPEHIGEHKKRCVLANFGASGDPTISWNSELSAFVWTELKEYAVEHLGDLTDHRNVCIYPDRTCQRSEWTFENDSDVLVRRQTTTSKELAHRDNPAEFLDGTTPVAGWVNVKGMSYFQCLPGSARLSDHGGFTPPTPEDAKALNERGVRYEVPEGHAVLFFPQIVHCVAASPIQEHLRVFHCLVFTSEDEHPMPDALERSRHCKPWPMPTGGTCKIVEANSYRNWGPRVKAYSRWFVDAVPRSKDSGYVPSALTHPEAYGLEPPAHCVVSHTRMSNLLAPEPVKKAKPAKKAKKATHAKK